MPWKPAAATACDRLFRERQSRNLLARHLSASRPITAAQLHRKESEWSENRIPCGGVVFACTAGGLGKLDDRQLQHHRRRRQRRFDLGHEFSVLRPLMFQTGVIRSVDARLLIPETKQDHAGQGIPVRSSFRFREVAQRAQPSCNKNARQARQQNDRKMLMRF